MPTLSVRAASKKKGRVVKAGLAVLLIGGLLFFVKIKKDMLVREASRFLQGSLSRESGLDVKIGKISGHLSGFIRFEQLRIEDPTEPTGENLIFSAREVRFRYRFLDFLTKLFDSKIEVMLVEPTVRWRPSSGLRREQFPFLRWMREWALAQKDRLRFEVKDLELILSPSRRFKEIDLTYENDALEMDIPLRHWQVMGADISTEVRLEGRFLLGLAGDDDSLRGGIRTEGTVVNWTPLPQESKFDFAFSQDAFHFSS